MQFDDLPVTYSAMRGVSKTDLRKVQTNWQLFADALLTPKETGDTVLEWELLEHAIKQGDTVAEKEANRLKSLSGGFVGGFFSSNLRRLDALQGRTVITLDADDCPPGTFEDIAKGDVGTDYEFVAYTTRTSMMHGREKLRLVFPVSKTVPMALYPAAARLLASEIRPDLSWFCPVSWRPNQLMYWPTCPTGGAHLFPAVRHNGEALGDKPFLDWNGDWSLIPHRSDEDSPVDIQTLDKSFDRKPPHIRAICNTIGITEAVETWLSDVYKRGPTRGRYRHVDSQGAAGALVYDDDRFLFSNHVEHDPAADGHNKNVYDLLRIHLFGTDAASKTAMDAWVRAHFKDALDAEMAFDEERSQEQRERVTRMLLDEGEEARSADEAETETGADNAETETEADGIDRFNGRYCHIIGEARSSVLLIDRTLPTFGTRLSLDAFRAREARMRLMPRFGGAGTRPTTDADLWLASPRRRTAETAVNEPDGVLVPAKTYNIHRPGFRIEPVEGDASPFFAHVRDIVCGGDKGIADYVVNKLAFLVQKPARRSNVCVIFYCDGRGAGRDGVLEWIGSAFHPEQYAVTHDIARILDKHSSLPLSRLCHLQESFFNGMKQQLEQFKAQVTRADFHHEPKFQASSRLSTFTEYWMTTNEINGIPMEHRDRRFLPVESADTWAQGVADPLDRLAYFQQVYSVPREVVLHHLLHHRIDWSSPEIMPHSALKDRVLAQSLRGVELFVSNMVETGDIPGSQWSEWSDNGTISVKKTKLLQAWQRVDRNPCSMIALAKALHAMTGAHSERHRADDGSRDQVFVLPPISKAEERLDRWLAGHKDRPGNPDQP